MTVHSVLSATLITAPYGSIATPRNHFKDSFLSFERKRNYTVICDTTKAKICVLLNEYLLYHEDIFSS